MNHSVSYQELKAKRLQNPEYAKQYLETALEDTCQDGNGDAFLLALQDMIEAHVEELEKAYRAALRRYSDDRK